MLTTNTASGRGVGAAKELVATGWGELVVFLFPLPDEGGQLIGFGIHGPFLRSVAKVSFYSWLMRLTCSEATLILCSAAKNSQEGDFPSYGD